MPRTKFLYPGCTVRLPLCTILCVPMLSTRLQRATQTSSEIVEEHIIEQQSWELVQKVRSVLGAPKRCRAYTLQWLTARALSCSTSCIAPVIHSRNTCFYLGIEALGRPQHHFLLASLMTHSPKEASSASKHVYSSSVHEN
jgi:hypothetical protein